MGTLSPKDKTADFIASDTILENKRKVVFGNAGRDLNLHDVLEINLDGQWWRIKTADGKLVLVDPAKVNYAVIS